MFSVGLFEWPKLQLRTGEKVAWDRTPMYAYGGLAKVVQIHHVCLLDCWLEERIHGIGIYIYVLVLISIRNTVWNTSHSSYGFGRKSEKSLSTVGTVVYGVYCLFEKISTFCFGFGFFVWGPEILPFGFKTSGWSLQQGKLVNQHQKGWNDGISPGWRGQSGTISWPADIIVACKNRQVFSRKLRDINPGW